MPTLLRLIGWMLGSKRVGPNTIGEMLLSCEVHVACHRSSFVLEMKNERGMGDGQTHFLLHSCSSVQKPNQPKGGKNDRPRREKWPRRTMTDYGTELLRRQLAGECFLMWRRGPVGWPVKAEPIPTTSGQAREAKGNRKLLPAQALSGPALRHVIVGIVPSYCSALLGTVGVNP